MDARLIWSENRIHYASTGGTGSSRNRADAGDRSAWATSHSARGCATTATITLAIRIVLRW
jgi:hypothetical protein